MIPEEKVRKAEKILLKKKTFTIDLPVSLLDCSIPGARLKLRQWGVYTSYNQNGRYYTLPSVPRFDENGLWHYRQICFSRQGTLKNTVVHLIQKSSSGLDGNQVGEIVGLSPSSFMHHFRNTPGIRREKHGGVYVYFSDATDAYVHQKEKRLEDLALSAQALSDTDAVVVLAALIKHHEISVEDIPTLPEIKSAGLHPHAVRDFLEHHGLLKKTAGTRP